MARMARAEVFAPDEVAVVHVMNRVVRRCYLLGDDPVSGKNYDHRKVMIENQLKRLAGAFGIDLLGFAIMSNHFHLILRSRPDVVSTWDDTEVARRWLLICPVRKNRRGIREKRGLGAPVKAGGRERMEVSYEVRFSQSPWPRVMRLYGQPSSRSVHRGKSGLCIELRKQLFEVADLVQSRGRQH